MSDILSQIEKIQGNVRDIKATWGNTIMTLDNIKSSLKADRQKAIEEAYQKGFEAGQHEATTLEYQQGLDEAWGTIIKIALIPYAEWSEIFDGQQDILSIVQKFSLSEVTAKLREYEQQKADEIKVGDEVTPKSNNSNWLGVVVGVDDTDAMVMTRDGYTAMYRLEILKKTDKHFPQMAELLNAMKGEQEKVCATCKYIHNILKCNTCYDFNKWESKEVTE